MTTEQSKEITFILGPDKEIGLKWAPGVFTPNATTRLLIQAVTGKIFGPVRLLDLGCGTGAVGVALHLQGLVCQPIYASDLSSPAVLCSRENFERYGCSAEVRGGSLFAPWQNMKFDVIVDDISGIAQGVAEVSPWFPGVPCTTGEDGIDLIVEIIRNAPLHLYEGGHFFFPVLSLSNVDKLLREAKEIFETVEMVGHQDWPLPPELKAHMPLLRKLHAGGSVKLQERFGMVLCYTEIYCATKPYLHA